MANLPVVWTKHLKDEKAKKEFEAYLRNSTQLVTVLLNILDDQERSLQSIENSITQFETPSWSERQAWINGRHAQIRAIKDLFNFIDTP
jgi:hypothetical protein